MISNHRFRCQYHWCFFFKTPPFPLSSSSAVVENSHWPKTNNDPNPQLDERLRREGTKTHKERVEELNRYLSNLSEHHDMYVLSLSFSFPSLLRYFAFLLFSSPRLEQVSLEATTSGILGRQELVLA